MFTGIIDHSATIQSIERQSSAMTLVIAHQLGQLTLGESIAIDGVCLTVTQADETTFTCQLSAETLRLTIATDYRVGQLVNCERAMQAQDRLGGHIVSGHVDATIRLTAIKQLDGFFQYDFCDVSPAHMLLLSTKGSVTINGVSLTVNQLLPHGFSVTLIPHTLSITNLSGLKENDCVNVEYDYFAKLVQRSIAPSPMPESVQTCDVDQAVLALKQGGMIVLIDDKDRENEGDLVVAAETVTAEQINFMAQYGRGLICMPMSAADFERLEIPMMVQNNQCYHQTGFGVSIGAATGITTGISAADRAHTIRVAANGSSTAADIVMPGHVFPLKARDGGVLVRQGHTEASVDLMRLAGLHPAAVICEVMKSDGTMARLPDLKVFAKQHQLPVLRIADLKAYLSAQNKSVTQLSSARLPTKYGRKMSIHVYACHEGMEWVAVTAGDLTALESPIVRLHSACFTGDILGSERCDCGQQLQHAMQMIAQEGGALLYLPQEGRGIGLANKVKAYVLQDQGLDTVEANHHLGFSADARDYKVAANILQDLGVASVRLLTNNPKKISALEKSGVRVSERLPLAIPSTQENQSYLQTKKEKMGHLL